MPERCYYSKQPSPQRSASATDSRSGARRTLPSPLEERRMSLNNFPEEDEASRRSKSLDGETTIIARHFSGKTLIIVPAQLMLRRILCGRGHFPPEVVSTTHTLEYPSLSSSWDPLPGLPHRTCLRTLRGTRLGLNTRKTNWGPLRGNPPLPGVNLGEHHRAQLGEPNYPRSPTLASSTTKIKLSDGTGEAAKANPSGTNKKAH
uniref:Uncharacterized protein n=1 Tax=Timema cristinae TaxID=61476 RepID=A0A7R9DJ02_TIMCR|nr:unnamed protein product [Timema cristinae]